MGSSWRDGARGTGWSGKPLDVGNGLLTGSVTARGELVALGAAHPRHGFVVLEGDAGFPDAARHDPAAVRAYRARLAEPAGGLGFGGDWHVRDVVLTAGAVRARLRAGRRLAGVVTVVPLGVEAPALLQHWTVEGPAGRLHWGGQAHLRRAALTQLTEGGVLRDPPPRLSVQAATDGLLLHARGLDTAVWIEGFPSLRGWRASGHTLSVPVDVGQGRTELTLRLGFGTTPARARAAARAVAVPAATLLAADAAADAAALALPRPPATSEPGLEPLVERAARYLRRCCALPVAGTVCLVTDHRILPLAWTRDAYYAAAALAASQRDGAELVRGHLRWLFERAERPGGAWARSYLPDGTAKDLAFQLDQQCYPWLELAEHVEATADVALLGAVAPRLQVTLDALERRRAPGTALFSSDENPADDPMSLPYHASSHVLLWHTLRRLAALLGRADLLALAAEVREAVLDALVDRDRPDPLLAYAGGLDGRLQHYHDANDLPTALAPLWGFLAPTDPLWRATMAFAFSPDNPAHAAGPYGGLGSRHTPGPWPLGDVQEYVWCRLTSQQARAGAVLDRLRATALWDGSLPEARDPLTGRPRSRHWFGWPGAALLLALRAWPLSGRGGCR